MKFLILLFSTTFYGQVLHHQMLSAQGQSAHTPDGYKIKQTVGQQSVTGTNSNKDYIVMQGFQQSFWYKYISDPVGNSKIVTYPNPFTGNINFQFSVSVTGIISVYVYDVLGRLVYEEKKNAVNSILTIDLTALPTAEYLVRLNTDEHSYFTKIIRQ